MIKRMLLSIICLRLALLYQAIHLLLPLLHCLQKKNYTLRLCVDYRRLNNLTIKNMYLIPRIDDFLDELFGALGFQRLILERGIIIIMRSGE